MAKKIAQRPIWLPAPAVQDIYSVCGHVSRYFADYFKHQKHNGYWLFNSVDILRSLAQANSFPLGDCKTFYYEVFEQEFDEEIMKWKPFRPDRALPTAVVLPASRRLEGYDVVTCSIRSPQCSPLACNKLATAIRTNAHCLFDSFDDAKARLEAGFFEPSEPGPFRIVAVYSID
jgi:hypothetical protein